jgi:hypothetical protein
MRRSHRALLSLAITLLAAPTALCAQTARDTAPDDGPLMTAPRPEDRATTTPLLSPGGVSGAAPSDELRPTVPLAPAPLTLAQARGLIGHSVRSRDGLTVGIIRDFVLTGPDGGLDRVVLAPGQATEDAPGAPGAVSLPVSALRTEGTAGDATVDMDAAAVASAPAFSDDQRMISLTGRR